MQENSDCTSKWVDEAHSSLDCTDFDRYECNNLDFLKKEICSTKTLTRIKGEKGCKITQRRNVETWRKANDAKEETRIINDQDEKTTKPNKKPIKLEVEPKIPAKLGKESSKKHSNVEPEDVFPPAQYERRRTAKESSKDETSISDQTAKNNKKPIKSEEGPKIPAKLGKEGSKKSPDVEPEEVYSPAQLERRRKAKESSEEETSLSDQTTKPNKKPTKPVKGPKIPVKVGKNGFKKHPDVEPESVFPPAQFERRRTAKESSEEETSLSDQAAKPNKEPTKPVDEPDIPAKLGKESSKKNPDVEPEGVFGPTPLETRRKAKESSKDRDPSITNPTPPRKDVLSADREHRDSRKNETYPREEFTVNRENLTQIPESNNKKLETKRVQQKLAQPDPRKEFPVQQQPSFGVNTRPAKPPVTITKPVFLVKDKNGSKVYNVEDVKPEQLKPRMEFPLDQQLGFGANTRRPTKPPVTTVKPVYLVENMNESAVYSKAEVKLAQPILRKEISVNQQQGFSVNLRPARPQGTTIKPVYLVENKNGSEVFNTVGVKPAQPNPRTEFPVNQQQGFGVNLRPAKPQVTTVKPVYLVEDKATDARPRFRRFGTRLKNALRALRGEDDDISARPPGWKDNRIFVPTIIAQPTKQREWRGIKPASHFGPEVQ